MPKKIRYKGIKLDAALRDDKELITNHLVKQIIRDNDISVSQDEVNQETELYLINLSRNVMYGAMANGTDPLETAAQAAALQREDVEEQVALELKTDILIRAVISEEQFAVSPEELEREVLAMSQRLDVSQEMIRGFIGEDLSLLKNDILRKKALDCIYDNAILK